MFRRGTKNCDVIDVFSKTKSLFLIEIKLPNIRKLYDFDEIFSVDLSMNKFYNAAVTLFKKHSEFFSIHLNLIPFSGAKYRWGINN